jgi:hypothetical protein
MALTSHEGGDLEDGGNLVIVSERGSSAETVTGAVGTNDDKSKNQQLNCPATCPKESWECVSAACALYHGHTPSRAAKVTLFIKNASYECNAKNGEEGGTLVVVNSEEVSATTTATEPVGANGYTISEQLAFVVVTVLFLACTFCFLNFGPIANGIWATIALAIVYGIYVCARIWMTW